MAGRHEVDRAIEGRALPVERVVGVHRVGAMEHHVPGTVLDPGKLEHMAERHAGPFADAAPAFHAIVPRDLGSRRHGPKGSETEALGMVDEPIDPELPILEAVGHQSEVGLVLRIRAAVGPEGRADVRLGIFSGQRARAEQHALGLVGQSLGCCEQALDDAGV